jgi:secreted Zn-dependent insulinase-like peptidase
LTEYAYDADLAGLVNEVDIHGDGISITMGGYNDKLIVLLQVVLEKIKNLEVREDRFAVMKEQVCVSIKMNCENTHHVYEASSRVRKSIDGAAISSFRLLRKVPPLPFILDP